MPIGGPSGRRVRNVERALSASTLLPTVAFAALGTVTVLLVAQLGMPPLGEVVGSSTHDGGRAVTMPRMSISVGPPLLARSTTARDRETTASDAPTGRTGPTSLAGPTSPTTLTLALPAPHAIAPPRGRETTTAGDPTGPTGPTALTRARQVAHGFAPPRGRETTAYDAQPVAMTAAVDKSDVTEANATTWEVIVREATIVAIRFQTQANAQVMVAPRVVYMLLTRAARAPAPEPDDLKSQKSQKSQTEDTSEHAKAAKSRS